MTQTDLPVNTAQPNPLQILIIHHGLKCLDGFTAAWATTKGCIARYGADDPTTFHNINFIYFEGEYDNDEAIWNLFGEGKAIPDPSKLSAIFIVDYSLPLSMIEKLAVHARVTMLDHHQTAYNRLVRELEEDYVEEDFDSIDHVSYDGKPGITVRSLRHHLVIDQSRSGAALAWEEFFNTPVPALVKYVEDYDLWKFKHIYTKPLNAFLRLEEQTIENWSDLLDYFSDTVRRAEAALVGHKLLAQHQQYCEQLVEQAEEVNINGHKGLLVNAPMQFASLVGHLLAGKCGTFGAVWQQMKGGKVKYSLRSEGLYNVEMLAKQFGGGGHRNAAGFHLSVDGYDPENGATLMSVQGGGESDG